MRSCVRRVFSVITVAVAVTFHGAPALAGLQVWDFQSWTQNFSGTGGGNSLNLTSTDGTSLTVTGWSDTAFGSNSAGVESAELVWSNSSALGVQNRQENSGLPDSSVDSLTSSAMGGFDMLLLEFDTEVSLSGLDLNWAVGGSARESTDLSILAWDGLGSGAINLGNWADILIGNGGGYDVVGNYSGVDLSYFSLGDTGTASSKWLIGAYNPIFGAGGDAGDDGFALASLTTMSLEDNLNGVNEVPLPGTLVLVLLGWCLTLAARRGRAVSVHP